MFNATTVSHCKNQQTSLICLIMTESAPATIIPNDAEDDDGSNNKQLQQDATEDDDDTDKLISKLKSCVTSSDKVKQHEYQDRLLSFHASTYYAKPACLSPLFCARFG
jgi:hypothetical protein